MRSDNLILIILAFWKIFFISDSDVYNFLFIDTEQGFFVAYVCSVYIYLPIIFAFCDSDNQVKCPFSTRTRNFEEFEYVPSRKNVFIVIQFYYIQINDFLIVFHFKIFHNLYLYYVRWFKSFQIVFIYLLKTVKKVTSLVGIVFVYN